MANSNDTRILPEGWRWARLADVLSSLESGSRPTGGAIGITEGVPSISAEHMTRSGSFEFSKLRFVPVQFYNRMSRGHIRDNDVLVVKDGATTGKVAFVDTQFPFKKAVVNEHAFVCRPNPDVVEPKYLFFWMWGNEGQAEIRANYQGAAIGGINQTFVDTIGLPLPPLGEQKRIAAILNEQMAAVEQARAAAEAQLEAAKALPAAYLRAVFSSPEAQQWPRRTLSEVADIAGGIQKTPDRAPIKFHRPYLTVRNVQRGYLDLTQVERFELTSEELSRLCLQDGDILIVEGNGSLGHIGRNALFVANGEEWIHQNHIIRVRLSREVLLPAFVSRFLNSSRGIEQMVEKAKTTSGLYTLSAGKVGSLQVPTPHVCDQDRIVAILKEQMASAERTRKAIDEELDAINKLSPALLRRAFNGGL